MDIHSLGRLAQQDPLDTPEASVHLESPQTRVRREHQGVRALLDPLAVSDRRVQSANQDPRDPLAVSARLDEDLLARRAL